MRQNHDNISLYLTLVSWNISHGYDPRHHGVPTWRLPGGHIYFSGSQGVITTHNFDSKLDKKYY